MPWLLRTFDKAKMYNLTMWLFLFLYPLLSVLNVIARSGVDETTGEIDASTNAVLWVGIVLILIILRFANLGYGYDICALLVKLLLTFGCPQVQYDLD